MGILISLSLAVLALVVLEIMLYAGGIFLRRASRNSFLSLSRKLLVAALSAMAFAGIEFARYHLAALLVEATGGASAYSSFTLWLVTFRVFSVPLLPALAFLATVFAAVRQGAIAACDRCNEWTPPLGGVIYGKSWGSDDLNCLKCAITKRQQAILLYPLTKPYTLVFWLTQGMWR